MPARRGRGRGRGRRKKTATESVPTVGSGETPQSSEAESNLTVDIDMETDTDADAGDSILDASINQESVEGDIEMLEGDQGEDDTEVAHTPQANVNSSQADAQVDKASSHVGGPDVSITDVDTCEIDATFETEGEGEDLFVVDEVTEDSPDTVQATGDSLVEKVDQSTGNQTEGTNTNNEPDTVQTETASNSEKQGDQEATSKGPTDIQSDKSKNEGEEDVTTGSKEVKETVDETGRRSDDTSGKVDEGKINEESEGVNDGKEVDDVSGETKPKHTEEQKASSEAKLITSVLPEPKVEPNSPKNEQASEFNAVVDHEKSVDVPVSADKPRETSANKEATKASVDVPEETPSSAVVVPTSTSDKLDAIVPATSESNTSKKESDTGNKTEQRTADKAGNAESEDVVFVKEEGASAGSGEKEVIVVEEPGPSGSDENHGSSTQDTSPAGSGTAPSAAPAALTNKPKPVLEYEYSTVPLSFDKLSKLTVNIGPIKLEDLKSESLHNILRISTAFEIKFEPRSPELLNQQMVPESERVGTVRLPFTVKTPAFLVKVASKLGALTINGRDLSIKFPETFNKAVEDCKKFLNERNRDNKNNKLSKFEQIALKKRRLYIYPTPKEVTAEQIRDAFPEALKVTARYSTREGAKEHVLMNVSMDFPSINVRKKIQSGGPVTINNHEVLLQCPGEHLVDQKKPARKRPGSAAKHTQAAFRQGQFNASWAGFGSNKGMFKPQFQGNGAPGVFRGGFFTPRAKKILANAKFNKFKDAPTQPGVLGKRAYGQDQGQGQLGQQSQYSARGGKAPNNAKKRRLSGGPQVGQFASAERRPMQKEFKSPQQHPAKGSPPKRSPGPPAKQPRLGRFDQNVNQGAQRGPLSPGRSFQRPTEEKFYEDFDISSLSQLSSQGSFKGEQFPYQQGSTGRGTIRSPANAFGSQRSNTGVTQRLRTLSGGDRVRSPEGQRSRTQTQGHRQGSAERSSRFQQNTRSPAAESSGGNSETMALVEYLKNRLDSMEKRMEQQQAPSSVAQSSSQSQPGGQFQGFSKSPQQQRNQPAQQRNETGFSRKRDRSGGFASNARGQTGAGVSQQRQQQSTGMNQTGPARRHEDARGIVRSDRRPASRGGMGANRHNSPSGDASFWSGRNQAGDPSGGHETAFTRGAHGQGSGRQMERSHLDNGKKGRGRSRNRRGAREHTQGYSQSASRAYEDRTDAGSMESSVYYNQDHLSAAPFASTPSQDYLGTQDSLYQQHQYMDFRGGVGQQTQQTQQPSLQGQAYLYGYARQGGNMGGYY